MWNSFKKCFENLTVIFFLMTLFLPASAKAADTVSDHAGEYNKWERIELKFTGPHLTSAGNTNPFDILIDVEFIAPDQRRFLVPGYFDGNGEGAPNGNIWAVRFSADQAGRWTFRTLSDHVKLDGNFGSFKVKDTAGENDGYFSLGRLEYVGSVEKKLRYFKFRDGPFWLKAGCDNPENFLGRSPNFDTMEERKAAIDYLSERGINSLYIMTQNIDGDFRDVWPWLGETESEAKQHAGRSARFDISRLREWQELFEYMQKKEVVPYLVLEDDSAWSGYDYKRYYLEIIARFGYLPALIVNLGEEFRENHTLQTGIKRARYFRSKDPFSHPLGIHDINSPELDYLGAEVFDYAAIQTKGTDPLEHNAISIEWQKESRKNGLRIPMISFDEPRPVLQRQGWWSAYLGGAVWQLHAVQPFDAPHPTREPAWTRLGGARRFMESLPFWEMIPDNSVIASGKGFCMRKTDDLFAIYLPKGTEVRLDLPEGKAYRVEWWSPENGWAGQFLDGGTLSSEKAWLKPPDTQDWAIRLTAIH